MFEDRNGDGLRDPGEPGIAEVRVSDSRRVTVNDSAGAWQLEFLGDAVFFVMKPADWMTPVDAWMLPSFYYVYQPDGSPPGLRGARVVVNLFDGGPRSGVELRLPGRAPLAMQRRAEIDPSVNELFARHSDVKKPWVDAVPSSHWWVADLPDDLEPGTYTVSVRARDEFGRSHHAHRILEIEGSSAGDPRSLAEPR